MPTINPREPLTNKARKAIYAYAIHRCKGLYMDNLLITYALEAERMTREKLYAWLLDHGYVWDTLSWYKPDKKTKSSPSNKSEN